MVRSASLTCSCCHTAADKSMCTVIRADISTWSSEAAWPMYMFTEVNNGLQAILSMTLHRVQADPLYIGIFVSSMLFPALASIIKEKIFAEAKEELGGKPLDIFVVNSFGSGAQAVGVLLLLPVLTSLRGLSLSELPQYVGDGKACLLSESQFKYVAMAEV